MKLVRDGQRWGNWKLHADNLTLVLNHGEEKPYDVELEMIRDSASMLDWIFQVQSKAWATNKITGDLLAAFHDIFDPQANLCSFDQNKRIDSKGYLRRLLRR
jgi:hypothetical protein